jgi:hypothetical protein
MGAPGYSKIRFAATYQALRDCLAHMEDDDLSPSEQRYRYKLVQVAQCIVDEHGEMEAPKTTVLSRRESLRQTME